MKLTGTEHKSYFIIIMIIIMIFLTNMLVLTIFEPYMNC